MLTRLILAFMLILTTMSPTFAASSHSDPHQLSTHILDIGRGQGARNVEVRLFKQTGTDTNPEWKKIAQATTNDNGRITDFLAREKGVSHQGIYKLVFMTGPYFKALQQPSFYPYVEVVFHISDESHYHVPITLSNFGYSTYRGN